MVSSDETNRALTAAAAAAAQSSGAEAAWTHQRHVRCTRGFSIRRKQRIRLLSAKPVPSQSQRVRDKRGEPCRAVHRCNFKMTAEEASGASEEDDSHLYADVYFCRLLQKALWQLTENNTHVATCLWNSISRIILCFALCMTLGVFMVYFNLRWPVTLSTACGDPSDLYSNVNVSSHFTRFEGVWPTLPQVTE